MYDLIVIGAGSGGVGLSRYVSNNFQKKVAVIEHKELGGTCVNVGCVPKKIMLSAANFIEDSKHLMPKFGVKTQLDFDFLAFKKNRDAYISRLNVIYDGMLKESNVDLYKGFGKFVSPTSVMVNGPTGEEVLQGTNVMIATGSTPNLPEFPGKEFCHTSDAVFAMEKLPKKMVVIGGGYIGVEMAQIFTGYGVDVTLVEKYDILGAMVDEDLREVWKYNAKRLGLKVQLGSSPVKVVKTGEEEYRMELSDGSQLEANFILFAAGRTANLKELQLAQTGVQLDSRGFIEVDHEQKTSVDNVYALGDVTARPQLTPLAIKTGRTWAEYYYGGRKDCLTDYDNIPTVIFSHPPIGSVGLGEAKAVAKYGKDDIVVYTSNYYNLAESMEADKSLREKSFMKVICLKSEQERIVGVQMIGKGTDEMMQAVGVAVKMGARKRDLDNTLAIHPTSSEELVLMQPKIWGLDDMKRPL